MIKVELVNGRKLFCCNDIAWFNNQVLIDRSKFNIDYDFIEFTVWKFKRKLPFMKYQLESLDLETINKNYILSVHNLGNDNEWFEKYCK